MRLRPQLIPFFALTILLYKVPNASAIKQYHCGGRVQYLPCQSDGLVQSKLHHLTSRSSLPSAPPPTQGPRKGSPFAVVSNQNLKRISGGRGHWSGMIRGNGYVEVSLESLEKGVVTSSTYMGHFWLNNGSSSYNFRGPLTSNRSVTWRVVARAS